jgi:hypothetical protein
MARPNLLDPKVRAAKKRKQAIVLGVAFAAVLAFSVPKTMKMMNQSASPAAAPTPAASADASDATAKAVAVTASGAQVVDADVAPVPLEGQLVDLTAFEAKDPFVQQRVAVSGFKSADPSTTRTEPARVHKQTSPGAVAPRTPATDAGHSTPATDAGRSTPPAQSTSTAPSAAPPPPATAPPAQPTAATISVNGVSETVAVATDFPAGAPLFRLVKLTTKSAGISIAGGTLASGAPTVKLQLGKPLTLMNTADGTRYVLILVSTGAAPPAGASTPNP